MANIAVTLSVKDQMTKRLQKAAAANDKLVSSMKKLEKISKSSSVSNMFKSMTQSQGQATLSFTAFNTTITETVKLLEKILQKLEEVNDQGLEDVEKDTKKTPGFLSKMNNAFDTIGGSLKGLFSLSTFQQLFGFINQGLDELNKRLKFEVQLSTVMSNNGAADGIDGVIAAAEAMEGKTTFGADAMIGGAAELGTYLSDPAALEAMLPTLADYAAGMGGIEVTAEQMVQYGTDLGKALDGSYDGLLKKGFVLTDAQKQIIEFGTELERVQVITDVIGQSWGGLAENFAQTPEGKMQQFSNVLGSIAETIGGSVVNSFMALIDTVTSFVESPAGQWLINGVGVGLNIIISGVQWLAGLLAGFFQIIYENWPIVQGALLAVATLLLPIIIIKLLIMAAIWLAMNWPILLIIAIIAAVVLIIIKLGATFQDVAGFIMGSIYVVGALFKNLGLSIANIALGIKEAFFACVDNIRIAFKNRFADIKIAFLGFVNVILKGVLKILEFLNKIPGVSIDTASISQKILDNSQAMADAAASKEEFHDIGEAFQRGASTYDAFGEGWASDAFNAGQEKGRNMAGGFLNALEGFSDSFDGLGDMPGNGGGFDGGDDYGGGGGGGSVPKVDKVGEVGRVNDEVDISKEDLELLRDIAEARFVQNFVTLTPQVSMKVDTLNNDVDADRMLAEMERRLEEEFVATAEGVYA